MILRKIESENTTLIVIESGAVDFKSRPTVLMSSINSILKYSAFERKKIDVKICGNHVAIFIDKNSVELFCDVLSIYLEDVVVKEMCSAYDERYMIALLMQLDIDEKHNALTETLSDLILKHCDHAERNFNSDYNFHSQSNVESLDNGKVIPMRPNEN